MNNQKTMLTFLLTILLALTACATPVQPQTASQPVDDATATDTPPPAVTSEPAPTATATVQPVTTDPLAALEMQPDPAIYLNIAYPIEGIQTLLADGHAEVEAAPGASGQIVTDHLGFDVYGDLNADQQTDAAFLLTQNSGGTGRFTYLAAAVTDGESMQGLPAVILGDRIIPQSVFIDDGLISVVYLERYDWEPMASDPTHPASRAYRFVEGELQEVPLPPRLTNRLWTWVRTQMNDGSLTTPNLAGAFTLLLGEDGTLSGTTDCNSFSTRYVAQDGLLSFGDFVSTDMFCEGAQEGQFVRLLGEVQSYLILDGQLVLEIRYDSGQIILE